MAGAGRSRRYGEQPVSGEERRETAKCGICSSESRYFAHGTILGKHAIAYFRCDRCGFLQTETPYWLPEAYTRAINRSDTGLVDRNLRLATATRTIITRRFDAGGRFVDYGGGYGLFVRLMRDAGFDYYRFDRYCENLFARGFDAESAEDRRYELVSAFEVFEHLADPLDEIARMLKLSSSVLFTTELLPDDCPKPDTWPYYGLDHGQHISFYSRKTLQYIADRFRIRFTTDGANLHMLTADKDVSSFFLRYVSAKMRIFDLLKEVFGRRSLILADYRKLTGKDVS
jgi:Methyltransferase domain